MDFKTRMWQPIEDALNDIENHTSYYFGSTLCIDDVVKGVILLNLNGKGCVVNENMAHGKDGIVHLPHNITKLVRNIYREIRGKEPTIVKMCTVILMVLWYQIFMMGIT